MKAILILLLLPTLVFAGQDRRISDGDSHVLDITSGGELKISFTNGAIINTSGAKDRRLSDDDGDVLDINSNGTVTIKFGTPT